MFIPSLYGGYLFHPAAGYLFHPLLICVGVSLVILSPNHFGWNWWPIQYLPKYDRPTLGIYHCGVFKNYKMKIPQRPVLTNHWYPTINIGRRNFWQVIKVGWGECVIPLHRIIGSESLHESFSVVFKYLNMV